MLLPRFFEAGRRVSSVPPCCLPRLFQPGASRREALGHAWAWRRFPIVVHSTAHSKFHHLTHKPPSHPPNHPASSTTFAMLGFTTNLLAVVALTVLPATHGSTLRSLQDTILANVCTIENGFDYVGFDISNAPSASADGCCDKCGGVANCAAWSWSNYNGGTCWFKSGRGEVAANAGVKSALFFGAQVPFCQVENNVDYVNNDIGNKPSATAEGCCSICQTTAGCRAFSWNNDNGGTCYLKSKGGQKIAKAGVRSAMAYPTGPSDCPAQEYGVDYVGNDMTNKPSATADGCCSICRGILNCRAYSWSNQNGGTCYLKSGKTGTIAKGGVISAQVYANQIAKCNWEREVDYINNDVGNAPGAVESCCQKCSDFAGCRAYSWNNFNGGTCWFKSNKGTAVSKPGVISSVVYY